MISIVKKPLLSPLLHIPLTSIRGPVGACVSGHVAVRRKTRRASLWTGSEQDMVRRRSPARPSEPVDPAFGRPGDINSEIAIASHAIDGHRWIQPIGCLKP